MSAVLALYLSTLAIADPGTLDAVDDARNPYFEDLLEHWERADGPRFIVNGETTTDFPATVMLAADGYGGMQTFCTGTLIHKRWVLTAAHCLDGLEFQIGPVSSMSILFGNTVSNPEDVIGWEDYVFHPSWNGQTLSNDIGLVKLATAQTDIDPIVVNDEIPDDTWIGVKLTFVGFGVTSDNANDGGTKRMTDLSVVDFDSQFIYTNESDTNTCYGDSGGPGYEVTDEGLEVAGVVSYGEGACVNGGRSGNTNVAEYLDWISEYLDPLTEYPPPDLGGDGGLGLGVDRSLEALPFGPERAGSGAQLGCSTTSGSSSAWMILLVLLARSTRPVRRTATHPSSSHRSTGSPCRARSTAGADSRRRTSGSAPCPRGAKSHPSR